MPEAPDLVVIREFLEPKLSGRKITAAVERKPLVLRNMTGRPFAGDIVGRPVTGISRRGKLLVFALGPERIMVISPMLTGGLRYCTPDTRMEATAVLLFDLDDGMQLRYFDEKRMGQVYYLPPERSQEIVRLENQGPDVIDEPMTLAQFKEGLRPFRGEVKGVLTRGQLVSGIGNAYADEVLFQAKLFPFKKRTSLSEADVARLHEAVYGVPRNATKVLRKRVGADIHKKVRDFLKVHGKGGEPCPVCGTAITAITANQRETNYCRKCQPGSLFKN
jgi:formamidopyrimidine-DNA glycosylase